MSRYGDHTPKEELWGYIRMIQQEGNVSWLQILAMLAQISSDIVEYELRDDPDPDSVDDGHARR